jgi:hypothetical protein
MAIGRRLKQLREGQGAKIVRSMICHNQGIGSEEGVIIVFKVAKQWLTLRGGHLLMEELLSDS